MEVGERLTRLEADEKNIFHQLSEIKDEVRDIRRLTAAVEKIAVKTDSIDLKVGDMGNRISALEKEPAESMSHYKKAIISALITTIIGTLAGAFFTFILKP